MLKKLKVMLMGSMPEETPVGIGTVTEADQWEYVLFASKR